MKLDEPMKQERRGGPGSGVAVLSLLLAMIVPLVAIFLPREAFNRSLLFALMMLAVACVGAVLDAVRK